MLAKLGNIKASFVPFQDSEASCARMTDAAARLFLRHQPAYKEKSEALDTTVTELSGITKKLKSMVLITYIDPADNQEYGVYKREQQKLAAEARRLQSTVSRYTAEKKKETADQTEQDALKAENDRLKQELAAAKGEQLGNFRELFKEMTQADKAAAKNEKKGDWQEKGRKKGGSGAGKGKGKGGKGKGGKGGGRKKGKGK